LVGASALCFLQCFDTAGWVHSLANGHSCLTPAKNEGIDINSSRTNCRGYDQSALSRRYLFIDSVVSINRNIVGYNKYLLVVTVVIVFVSYCYNYCDFR